MPAPASIKATWIFLSLASLLGGGCADTVHLTNGGAGENGILVSGTKGGAGNLCDRYTCPAGTDIGIGNYTNATGDVTAFTNHRPPTLLSPASWTNGSDTMNLNLQNEYLVPFFIWIVKGPFSSEQTVAINACIRTSQIWGDERMGVRFSTFQINDATRNPNASSFFAYDCSKASNMRSQIGFNAGWINGYYVDTVDFGSGPVTTNGVWCGGNTVAMGHDASDHLFSHEIGHGFSLEHVNTLTTFFDTTNVMHNASNDRRFLTEGQTFRAVVNQGSAINTTYNTRHSLITRNCETPTSTTDPSCPAVQKRICADGAAWPPN